jgi:hypothetical protein
VRTVRRPTGELKRKAGFESLKLGDPAAIIEWLRTHDPDGYDRFVKLVEKLDVVAFKEALDKAGPYVAYKPTGEFLVAEDVAGDVAVETKLAQVESSQESFTVAPKKRGLSAHQEDNDGSET